MSKISSTFFKIFGKLFSFFIHKRSFQIFPVSTNFPTIPLQNFLNFFKISLKYTKIFVNSYTLLFTICFKTYSLIPLQLMVPKNIRVSSDWISRQNDGVREILQINKK